MLTGLINGIRGALVGNSVKDTKNSFPNTLTELDIATVDVAIAQNKETIIDEFVILPQTEQELGQGGTSNVRNQGNIYMDLVDTGAAQLNNNTVVRLQIVDSNGRSKGIGISERYVNLKTGATDPSIRFPFPATGVKGSAYDKVRLSVISPDAGKTLDVSASTISVSATESWVGA